MSSLLSDLNPEQLEAVTTTDGPLLVLAGAGSGKTRVITTRVAYLIKKCRVPPEAILAVTFTNKAAGEMAGRVAALLGKKEVGKKRAGGRAGRKAPVPTISTFHAFGARFVRAHAALLGYRPNFTIFDDQDQLSLLRGIMEESDFESAGLSPATALFFLQQAKSQGLTPRELLAPGNPPDRVLVGGLLAEYQETLERLNAVDFEDLLLLPNRLFREFPQETEPFCAGYRYLMVDEYQDTNRAQYQLMRSLAAPHGNVCVVGDDDQSIYGWRGAEPANILDFEKDFPRARVVRLERNYRSTDTILRAANQVIRNNPRRREKALRGGQGPGDPLVWLLGEDEADEMERVATHLRRTQSETGRPRSQFAILYRSNHQSRIVEDALREQGIPYRLVGGTRFFDRREIKDALAYLRLIYNTADEVSLQRVLNFPRRGIGRVSRLKLADQATALNRPSLDIMRDASGVDGIPPEAARSMEHFAQLMVDYGGRFESGPLGATFRDLLADIGFHRAAAGERSDKRAQERAEELVYQLELAVDRYGEKNPAAGLREFLEYAALFAQPIEDEKGERNEVTLMTVHAAKGLEFPFVYLVGMADELFPHKRALAEGGEEEERRLFYVAITRARFRLVFSMGKSRRRFGETITQRPSRFLAEIEPEMFAGDAPSAEKTSPAVREKKAGQARARFFAQLKQAKEAGGKG